jgi:hypothetical protein
MHIAIIYFIYYFHCIVLGGRGGAKMLLYGQAFREIRQPSFHSPLEY